MFRVVGGGRVSRMFWVRGVVRFMGCPVVSFGALLGCVRIVGPCISGSCAMRLGIRLGGGGDFGVCFWLRAGRTRGSMDRCMHRFCSCFINSAGSIMLRMGWFGGDPRSFVRCRRVLCARQILGNCRRHNYMRCLT